MAFLRGPSVVAASARNSGIIGTSGRREVLRNFDNRTRARSDAENVVMKDPFNLQRFVDAQSTVIDRVYAELRAGQKRSHWMWYIFPQISGLGASMMARKFAILSPAEAVAYLDHPLLGTRLRTCTELVNAVEGRSIEAIFGYPDYLKFRSSMSLFARVAPDEAVWQSALDKFFGGKLDKMTLDRLS